MVPTVRQLYRGLTLHQPLHSLVLRQVSVEPDEDGVRVDVLVQVGQQVPEDKTLIPGPVSGHPEPTVSLKWRQNNSSSHSGLLMMNFKTAL